MNYETSRHEVRVREDCGNINYEIFRNEVRTHVIGNISKYICEQCQFVDFFGIQNGMEEGWCTLCNTPLISHQVDVTDRRVCGCVEHWSQIVGGYPFERCVQYMWSICNRISPPLPVDKAIAWLYISNNMKKRRLDTSMRAVLTNTFITTEEWMRFNKYLETCNNAIDIDNGLFKLRVTNKIREKIQSMKDEWYMETTAYNSFIQWLPREMLEDISEIFYTKY